MEAVHRFGRIEVRPLERAVRVEGRSVALGARAFDILLALVERRDRLVPKNELLDLVWPGLVVEENNLAVHVSALRKVLGPQAIATIPGRGYRFTAASDEEADDGGAHAAAGASTAAAAEPAPIARTALPASTGPLHGRDDDLAALAARLAEGRLVALVGAAGIGKSALALAAAQARAADFPDGVVWVDLAELDARPDDPTALPRAVALAASLPLASGDAPLRPLVDALSPLRLLLVLDNAEHLAGPIAEFARALLGRVGGVRLLVTSQMPLKVAGEHVLRIAPLPLPAADASLDEAAANGAVALFVDQAHASDRHFALDAANVGQVVELCRRLDGVALAIRLAASRLPLLGLPGLMRHLGDRLQLLNAPGRGGDARQPTLLAALDWSHGLLDEGARRLYRRLAVFAGGFTLEAACELGRDGVDDDPWPLIEALGELVERSLVEVDGAERPRYRLLETSRAYARSRLEAAGERDLALTRHARVTADAMDAAYESYWSDPDRPWLERVEPELENVRAALEWAGAGDPVLALRLAGAASVAFLLTGQAPEARRRLALLEDAAVGAPAPIAGRYWLERSRLHFGVSGDRMRVYAHRAEALAREAGDGRALYLALRCAAGGAPHAGDEARAQLAEMAALASPAWPARLRLQQRLAGIEVARAAGRFAEASDACESVLALARPAGLDSVIAVALAALAAVELARGEAEAALAHARAFALAPAARRGNLMLQALATEADALLVLGRPAEARDAVRRLIDASRVRDWEWFGLHADLFGWLAAAQGRVDDAVRLVGHADAAWRRAGARDANARRAREQALAAAAPQLDPSALPRLLSDGEALDDAAVSALALAGAGSG